MNRSQNRVLDLSQVRRNLPRSSAPSQPRMSTPLLLTQKPCNDTFTPSPTRFYPHRGLSIQTRRNMMSNGDAWLRLLLEFEKISDVSKLRCTSKGIKKVVDEHPELWMKVQFSPPGLSRFARQEWARVGEKFLRKSAKEGNVEAQMMLAMMYHHGYTCPCHPLTLPGQ